MNEAEKHIAQNLFRTEALKIAPANKPFWYTSGTLGPYFINTHYLFGGQEAASDLLALIDEALAGDRLALPALVGGACLAMYEKDPDFRALMDYALTTIQGSYDAISGGERRDFYFSYVIAEKLTLPHITLFKDNSAIRTEPTLAKAAWLHPNDLSGMRILHVADLVTEASSYLRNWLPALRTFGAAINETLAIVDRKQGGREILAAEGVTLHALISLDDAFFTEAVAEGQITSDQKNAILTFQEYPHRFMKNFLEANPDFIASELRAGGKAAERAQRAIDQGLV